MQSETEALQSETESLRQNLTKGSQELKSCKDLYTKVLDNKNTTDKEKQQCEKNVAQQQKQIQGYTSENKKLQQQLEKRSRGNTVENMNIATLSIAVWITARLSNRVKEIHFANHNYEVQ